MKYTPATFAKALVAFVVSASGSLATSGVDLNHLTIGTVLAALGIGLTASGAVFVTPNKSHEPPASAAEQVINNIPVVVAQATAAVSDLNKVKSAAADLASIVPGVGPLAEAVIDSIKLP